MISAPREGDLFVIKASHNKKKIYFFQGRSGIVERIGERRIAADEDHISVSWLNGDSWEGRSSNIVDAGDGQFEGTPYDADKEQGSVIVKWKVAYEIPDYDTTLTEFVAKLGYHEAWPARKFTNSGWALATDPWGTEHWLPPRRALKSGPRQGVTIDQDYVFSSLDRKYRYEVAMQETKQKPLKEEEYWELVGRRISS